MVNIAIVRTFVKLRRILATNEELARKMAQHDQEIAIPFEHVQALLAEPLVTVSRSHSHSLPA